MAHDAAVSAQYDYAMGKGSQSDLRDALGGPHGRERFRGMSAQQYLRAYRWYALGAALLGLGLGALLFANGVVAGGIALTVVGVIVMAVTVWSSPRRNR